MTIVLSEGAYEHYSKSIKQAEESLRDIQVLRTPLNDISLLGKGNIKIEIKVKPFVTLHSDLSEKESFGFKIEFEGHSIGYTGDIHWKNIKSKKPEESKKSKEFKESIEKLKNCDIVIAHLGSIVNILEGKNFCNTFCQKWKNDKDNTGKCKNIEKCIKNGYKDANVNMEKLKEQTDKQNHLYLAGMANLFTCFKESEKKKLVIISEFGEELKEGIRMDLFHKFDDWFREINTEKEKKNRRCLPGDIGLTVDLVNGKILCHCCENYVLPENIKPVPYGEEEAICFVCEECRSVFSQHQIGAKLKNYCVNGRAFKKAPYRKLNDKM